MRHVVALLFLLVFVRLNAQQYGFEFVHTDDEVFQRAEGAVELSNGDYVIANRMYDIPLTPYRAFLNLLDSDGELKSRIELKSPGKNFSDGILFKLSDSTFLAGGIVGESNAPDSIWLGIFSNDLQLLSLRFAGVPGISDVMLVLSRPETDSTMLIWGWADDDSPNWFGYAGRMNYLTGLASVNIFKTPPYNSYAFDIAPRKDSIGFIIRGDNRLYLTDDTFGITGQMSLIDAKNQGINVPLGDGAVLDFTDSTYLISGWGYVSSTTTLVPDTTCVLVSELRASDLSLIRYEMVGEATHYVTDPGSIIEVKQAGVNSIVRSIHPDTIYVGGIFDYDPILLSKPSKFLLAKYDSALEKIWERKYGEDDYYYYMAGMLPTSDGGCLMYGNRTTIGQNVRDLYVLKVNADGLIVGESAIPREKVVKVYPNPASDVVRFDFGGRSADLRLLDVVGRVVYAGEVNSAEPVDVSSLPSGMYFYRLYEKRAVIAAGRLIIQHTRR